MEMQPVVLMFWQHQPRIHNKAFIHIGIAEITDPRIHPFTMYRCIVSIGGLRQLECLPSHASADQSQEATWAQVSNGLASDCAEWLKSRHKWSTWHLVAKTLFAPDVLFDEEVSSRSPKAATHCHVEGGWEVRKWWEFSSNRHEPCVCVCVCVSDVKGPDGYFIDPNNICLRWVIRSVLSARSVLYRPPTHIAMGITVAVSSERFPTSFVVLWLHPLGIPASRRSILHWNQVCEEECALLNLFLIRELFQVIEQSLRLLPKNCVVLSHSSHGFHWKL